MRKGVLQRKLFDVQLRLVEMKVKGKESEFMNCSFRRFETRREALQVFERMKKLIDADRAANPWPSDRESR